MTELSPSLQKAKTIAGGNAALGRLLGISAHAVAQWRQVPAQRVVDVERVTGVSRQELRPDVFAEDPGSPEGASNPAPMRSVIFLVSAIFGARTSPRPRRSWITSTRCATNGSADDR